jgi:hypothetical protein
MDFLDFSSRVFRKLRKGNVSRGSGGFGQKTIHPLSTVIAIVLFSIRPIPFRAPLKTLLSEMASLAGYTVGFFLHILAKA